MSTFVYNCLQYKTICGVWVSQLGVGHCGESAMALLAIVKVTLWLHAPSIREHLSSSRLESHSRLPCLRRCS
jgi:hypothetical protein